MMTRTVDPIDSQEMSMGEKEGDSDFVTNRKTGDADPQPN